MTASIRVAVSCVTVRLVLQAVKNKYAAKKTAVLDGIERTAEILKVELHTTFDGGHRPCKATKLVLVVGGYDLTWGKASFVADGGDVSGCVVSIAGRCPPLYDGLWGVNAILAYVSADIDESCPDAILEGVELLKAAVGILARGNLATPADAGDADIQRVVIAESPRQGCRWLSHCAKIYSRYRVMWP